jgi:hypothetical protein
MRVLFIVKRASESTWAVVEADVSENKNNARSNFVDNLTACITEWIKDTDDGKEAWETSCRDFNVGDLSSYVDSPWLHNILAVHGIGDLKVTIHSYDSTDNDSWYYDRILVDKTKLPKKLRERI